MLNKLIVPGNVGKNAGKKGPLLPYIFCGTPLPLMHSALEREKRCAFSYIPYYARGYRS